MRSAIRTVEKRWEIKNRHFPFGELLKVLEDFVFGLRIQGCRGLIQH